MTAGVLVLGGSSAHVVYPAPCPKWCKGSPECGKHREQRYHEGSSVSVPLGAPDVTASVTVSRDDDGIATGEPYVFLAGDGPIGNWHDWSESIDPDAAIELGQALIAAGMEAAGRARRAVTR